MAHIFVLFKII